MPRWWEIIASIPRYDFNWQLTYKLAQPKKIPAGTWAVLTGSWDKSVRLWKSPLMSGTYAGAPGATGRVPATMAIKK